MHTQTSSEQARKYKVAGVLGCGWFGGIGLLGLALGSLSVGAFGILAAAGLGALLLYLYRIYSSLTVRVDGEKVSVTVGTRAPFEIPLGDISGCSVTPLPFSVTAMWGRRRQADFVGLWSPFRRQGVIGVPRAFWTGGGEWVVVELVGGRQICIGSDEPGALAAAIDAAIGGRPADRGARAAPAPVQPLSVL